MVVDEVKKYYDENSVMEWERLEKRPFEFIFTTYMMDKHIKCGDSILDIGGGPGRYSIHYAKKGCDVTLVDLSSGNIELAKIKASESGVDFPMYTENCLNLDTLNLPTFDHVFLMGPLYHLLSERERIDAVSCAVRRLKPGGILYCSFILDSAGLIYDLKNGPGFFPEDIKNPATAKLIDCIVDSKVYEGPAFTRACFFNQNLIEPFMSQFGLEKLHLFGQEGILGLNDKQVLDFPKDEFELWIATAKRLLDNPNFLAFSEHAMYVARKPLK